MSKSYLVTDASRRDPAPLGRFQPRADMNRFGVIWAAVEGSTDERWPQVGDVQTNGVQVGASGARLQYDEFKDASGQPHDIIMANGLKLREMVCPIEFVRQKEKMEADASTALVKSYDRSVKEKANPQVTMTSETTISQLRPQRPPEVPRADAAKPRNRKWTPEQKAAASARAKARMQLHPQPA